MQPYPNKNSQQIGTPDWIIVSLTHQTDQRNSIKWIRSSVDSQLPQNQLDQIGTSDDQIQQIIISASPIHKHKNSFVPDSRHTETEYQGVYVDRNAVIHHHLLQISQNQFQDRLFVRSEERWRHVMTEHEFPA